MIDSILIEHLNIIMWYALIILSILFTLSGLDDLLLDFAYWIRFAYRKHKTRRYKKLDYQDLAAIPEKKAALLIPCWMESLIIGDMLNYNLEDIDYGNYDVFVGAYPNDVATIQEVEKIQKKYNNLFLVVSPHPGPTSKADNLNSVYHFMLEREKKFHIKYEIFVLHDVEDVIHPLSLKLYNYLIPKKDMVQVPIFPLPLSSKYMTHWTYADEFAEIHTKELIIREAFFGFVPSAGVGTALGARAVKLLADKYEGRPFNDKSLVEDYDMAYRLSLLGANEIFLVQHVDRVKKVNSWLGFGKPRPKIVREYVATYGLFPKQYSAAIKQKGRWSYGIALQQWKESGWQGSMWMKVLLMHDRKALISNFINGFGYIVLLYWIFIYFYNLYVDPDVTTLGYFLNAQPWVWTLIIICTLFMIERLMQRAIASYRVYGLIPAILSIPRTIYSNVINLNSIIRAYRVFFKSRKPERTNKKNVKWEKTTNRFPESNQLINYRRKLGDILLQERMIDPKDLEKALIEQDLTGESLGVILERNKHVSARQVIEALARQYHLSIVTAPAERILSKDKLDFLSSEDYNWMLSNKLFPIDYDGKVLTVAISNPGNYKIRNELIYNKAPNQKVVFVLNDQL
ncbi:bacteriophage N4 adsorption protein B [Legionella wadsworthii]|uniref:Bacteriophage N4 adsorption protein B n=1 Tax=Legionella wadsworthii TaxID=28088 RepID=A0A378LWA2_9GAMM|nr:glycosyl transferase family protein [Legionella wadsworthii]STY28331.1 bacteriophage N4 adsorption protein B [Legionella wadsworthii]